MYFICPGCRAGKLFFFSFISMLVKTQALRQGPWNIHINKKTNYNNFNDTLPAPAAEWEYLVRAFFPKNLHVTLKAQTHAHSSLQSFSKCLHLIFKYPMQVYIEKCCQCELTDGSDSVSCWRSDKSSALQPISPASGLLQRASGESCPRG